MTQGVKHFLNPIEELELKEAVDTKKKKATIGGRDFTLKYENDRVFVQIKDGFVPCGWFDPDKIAEFEE